MTVAFWVVAPCTFVGGYRCFGENTAFTFSIKCVSSGIGLSIQMSSKGFYGTQGEEGKKGNQSESSGKRQTEK
jgi:hypothetical protein